MVMLRRRKILVMKQEPIMKLNVMITAHMTRPSRFSTTSHARPLNARKARCNELIGVKNAKSTLRLLDSRQAVVESESHTQVGHVVDLSFNKLFFSVFLFSYRGRPQNNRGGPRTNGYYYNNRYNNQNNYRPRNNNRNQTNAGQNQSTGVPPQPSQPKPVGNAAAS